MHYTTAMNIIEKKLIDLKMIDETKEVSYTLITDEEEMRDFFFAVGIGSFKHWIIDLFKEHEINYIEK